MAEQMTSSGPRIIVEMWADVGCPWCYVGGNRLRSAIAQRPDADRFDVVVRSFQLDPDAPSEPEPNADSFIRTHGGTADDVLAAERQMQALAREEGLAYAVDRRNGNSFDLHRVVQYANDRGRGAAFFFAVQDGFFGGTLDPYRPGTLAEVARTVGLGPQRVDEVLAGDEYADRVRADRGEGMALGATGVPFVVADRRVAAPGAQSAAGYGALLEQVAAVAPTGQRADPDESARCVSPTT